MLFSKRAKMQARIDTLEATLMDMINAAEIFSKQAVLTNIIRDGRSNTFVFVRNGKLHRIETMGLISDDIAGWKRDLIE